MADDVARLGRASGDRGAWRTAVLASRDAEKSWD
jgi:hypothetical protein